MKQIFSVAVVLLVAHSAMAQVPVGPGFFLDSPTLVGDTITIGSVGGTASIELWITNPGYVLPELGLAGADAILRGYDQLGQPQGSSDPEANYVISSFTDQVIPASQMQRVSRGDATADLPNAHPNDYQYVADDPIIGPGDPTEGWPNFSAPPNAAPPPITVLADVLNITSTALGESFLGFALGGQAPGGFIVDIATGQAIQTLPSVTGTGTFGTTFDLGCFCNVIDQGTAIRINVVPEPATLAMLAIGGLSVVRRRR
jgi:hypothetical protein